MNTRKQILEAAERLIQTKGLSRATTKEIAREAGCAEGTLYKHFESKEMLFLAIIKENQPYVVETLNEHVPGSGTIEGNLQKIGLAILAYYDKLVPLSISFFADSDLLASYRALLEKMNAGPHRLCERVAEYIQAEQQLGRINAQQDPLMVSALLLGPCFQYVFNRHFVGNTFFPETEQAHIAGLVQALMAGLSPQVTSTTKE